MDLEGITLNIHGVFKLCLPRIMDGRLSVEGGMFKDEQGQEKLRWNNTIGRNRLYFLADNESNERFYGIFSCMSVFICVDLPVRICFS